MLSVTLVDVNAPTVKKVVQDDSTAKITVRDAPEPDEGDVIVTVDLVPGMKTTTTTYPDGTTDNRNV